MGWSLNSVRREFLQARKFHPFLKRAASSEPPITAKARRAHDRIRLEEPDPATEAIERAEERPSLPVMTGHWSAERTAVKRLNRA